MSTQFQLVLLILSAFLLYANAGKPGKRTNAPNPDEQVKIVNPSDSNDHMSPFKKQKPAVSRNRKSSSKIASKTFGQTIEVSGTPSIGERADGVVPGTSAAEYAMDHENALESTAESIMVPEHYATVEVSMEAENVAETALSTEATNAEVTDPKSLHAELLEMNDVLQWEMAVRTEDEQVIDRRGDLVWFPALIYQKLATFVQNAPADLSAELKAELSKIVEHNKVQPIDVDEQIVHIFEVENSLDKLDEELSEQIMSGIKATPAVLDIVLDTIQNEVHEDEKMEFLWKLVNRKPTHYVKNVAQFLGRISIAMAYLSQTNQVGQWALKKDFLTAKQFSILQNQITENVSKLRDIQHQVASKMGINLAEIGIDELLAQKVPSLGNVFIQNLEQNLAKIQEIAQLDQVQISAAQIGTLFVLNSLNIANGEVEKLEDEIVGIELTWPVFRAVGDVSKAAQLLKQIQI